MSSVRLQRRYAVIMAGGVGTRFWPMSREARPKQLLSLTGPQSMLAETVRRLRGAVPAENIMVVTGKRYRRDVAKALPELPARNILCEPVGRNTAPCIGWSALEVAARRPDAVMAGLPAHHVNAPAPVFRKYLARAVAEADSLDRLLTFGIRPDGPATGYGYIKAGNRLVRGGAARNVDRFCEKPSLARAKRFVAAGNYYWNAGMFVWKATTVIEELARWLPKVHRGLERMEAARRRGRIPQSVIDKAYPGLPDISIDYGVMERSRRAAVIEARFQWNDIGSWDAVGELWPKDAHGNASRKPLLSVDASNNIVAVDGREVALVGVADLAIIDSGDALLVCRRDRSQEVRRVVEALRSGRRKDLL